MYSQETAANQNRHRAPFHLGPWLIEPQLNRISSSRASNRVEPKVMQVLLYLAKHPNQVISREELQGHIWGDTIVGDGSLTHLVSKLRQVLEDNPRSPQFIETISKTGYRLIAHNSERTQEKNSWLPLQNSVFALSFFILVLAISGVTWYILQPPSQYSTTTYAPARPLTTLPGRERDASISPSGNHVAFAWAGPDAENMNIYIKAIDEENPLQITHDPAIDVQPVWSPDEQRVAFLRYEDGNCHIYMAQVMGGSPRKVAECKANNWGDLAWSPDGRWLAYPNQNEPNEPYSIYLLSAESFEKKKLTYPANSFVGDHAPVFSPDSKSLSFVRSLSLRIEDLYVVSLESDDVQQLTFDDKWIQGHTWTPDGEDLIFSSTRSGFFNLWRVQVGSQNLKWVPVTGGESLVNPVISTKSQNLVYEQWSYDANIWQVLIDSETDKDNQLRQLIGSTQWDSHPSYSPDGNYIAFTSRRSGELGLWMCKWDGSNPVRLSTTGNSFESTMAWSPDGQHIVFSAREDNNIDLYSVHVESQKVHRLTTDESVELNPVVSHDGRWIYFSSDRTGSWQIWRIASDGSQAIQITESGGIYATESLDGESLYFTKHNEAGIWKRSMHNGPETLYIDALDSSDWGNWAVVSHGIYFISRTEQGATLLLWDELKQTTVPVVSLDRAPLNQTLAISPNSNRILFAQMDRNESDLMLVENFR